MSVDYRKQYTPDQLEPFWPNETIRLAVVTLCTLAIITVLAVLPVVLDRWGLGHWIEESEPANPRVTPVHIRPEWYFLAVYQSLKLAPQEVLGLSGKTIGVLSQGVLLFAILLVPFWTHRWSDRPPGVMHRLVVTLVIGVFVGFTLWAAWPPGIPMTILVCAAIVLFYVLLARERRMIRRVLQGRRGSSTK
jgi:quinol-cytochrome oxidoreductase complex cytochrome b subunit